MERKFLQKHWKEMRSQIGEWWDDLTDEDLDSIDGKQEQLISVLQERYGYTRNLAFMEVKIRLANYHPELEDEYSERHPRGLRGSQNFGRDNDDEWPNNSRSQGSRRFNARPHSAEFANQSNK